MVMQLIGNEWFNVVESFNPETGDKHTVKNKQGIVDVPVAVLLDKWEELVIELDCKVRRLYECIPVSLEDLDEDNTDFKEIYGANNQKVRDNHVKSELSELVDLMKDLEFRIDFIKGYVSLLREVIRAKQNIGVDLDE